MELDLEKVLIKQREIDNEFFPGLKQETDRGYWSTAVGEEIGELQGKIKKMNRNLKRDGLKKTEN